MCPLFFRQLFLYENKGLEVPNFQKPGLSGLFSIVNFSDMVLQKQAKKHCKFPLPSQLLIMVIMTSVSYFLDLSKEMSVRTIRDIGAIPTGAGFGEDLNI